MASFKTMPLADAKAKTMPPQRAHILPEYQRYIEQAESEEQAGVLEASHGERLAAVRRRLGDAARMAGKSLEIRKDGDTIIFWVKGEPGTKRGRPRKGPAS